MGPPRVRSLLLTRLRTIPDTAGKT